MKYCRRGAGLLLLLSFCVSAFGCQSAKKPNECVFYEFFDTVCYIYDYGREDEDVFGEKAENVRAILKTYHEISDRYHEYEGVVNIATINAHPGESLTVSRELFDLLTYAKSVYGLTGGKTNVAMGAVLSLWHDFREDRENGGDAPVPTEAALREAAEHTDIEDLLLDGDNLTVALADPCMSLDLGAIAKGYATERAGEYLLSVGGDAYVLNFGGNVKILGTKKNGDGYVTGIRDPASATGGSKISFALAATSCVCSGDYERYVEADGVRYHHVIDPDTLYPASYYTSVSVITPDSALADALSTAVFCMPEAEARALAEAIGGVDLVFIYQDGTVLYTDGLSP